MEENRTTTLEYSSDSSLQTQDNQNYYGHCVPQPTKIKTEVAFSAKTAMPQEDSTSLRQMQEEKQEQEYDAMRCDE